MVKSFEKQGKAQSNDYFLHIIYMYKKPEPLPARRLHCYHQLHDHYLLRWKCIPEVLPIYFFFSIYSFFCHFIIFLLLNLENSNLVIVIMSIKTEFVVHFSYVWNGASINAKIPKDYKNNTVQCLLKPVLNMLECWQML